MKQVTKRATLLSVLFGNNEVNNEYDVIIKDPEQIESQRRVNAMGEQTEHSIVTEGNKSSNGGGFSAGLKSKEPTLNKMREKLKDPVNTQDRGREDL